MQMVPYQLELRPALPVVHGNVDYNEFRQNLQRMDRILIDSGVEAKLISWRISQHEDQKAEYARQTGKDSGELSWKERACIQKHTVRALRCNVVRELIQESARGLSRRLADSELLQWFCRIRRVEVIRVPSKSTLDRYEKMIPEEVLREAVDKLNGVAASTNPQGEPELGLEAPLDIEALFLDTSCVKANIHFPVDWVLLRDAVRTLIKGTTVIRKHGLKNRMNEPSEFIREMNRLSIEMTHTRRRPDSRKERKRVLRLIKKLVKKVRGHAKKHRDLLENERERTDLSEREAAVIVKRIDQVLDQLPQALHQAHERIIGERKVPNKEKILSLYEPDIHVLVRGKAGAEVEFGNTLLLAEQSEGVIVDWKLIQEQAPADSTMIPGSLDRFKSVFGVAPDAMAGDRGFDSKRNQGHLEKRGVFNAICPRSVVALRERMKEERFVRLQRRRAQTEPRIAIFKNGFLGRPMRSKGFTYRTTRVTQAVLAHNLWVLSRLPTAEEAANAFERIA